MSNPRAAFSWPLTFVSALGSAVLVPGCRQWVNPFRDELAGRPPVTTPSAEAATAVPVERAPLRRAYAEVEVRAADSAITHGPLYFEDPFDEAGSENASFAWTGEDWWAFVYGPSRFLVNAVLFPVSSAVTPPWLVLASDGRSGRHVFRADHDAAASGKGSR